MRATLSLVVATLLSLAGHTAIAADDSSHDELEKRIRAVNSEAEKEGNFKRALHHVAIETGVPESKVEAQHQRNPDMGLSGIMLANVMAAETKKEPSEFIKERKSGKKWAAIAKANNVSTDKLTRRLDNLDRAISAPPGKTDDNKQKKEKRDR